MEDLRNMPIFHFCISVRRCLNDDVIDKFFPLHNKPELKKLGQEWYGSTRWQQPLRKYLVVLLKGLSGLR